MNTKYKKIGSIILIIGFLIVSIRFIGLYKFKLEGQNEANSFVQNIDVSKDNAYKDLQVGEKICAIEIPDINLKHTVVEGTDKEQIRKDIGHFEYTAFPGEYGNFAIAGHDTNLFNEVFKDLKDLDIGTEIIVNSYTGNFKYKISDKTVIESTDYSVINQDVTKKEMTLITCAQKGKKRLAIKAELIE